MTDEFDRWSAHALSRVADDSTLRSVEPRAHPGRLHLTHRSDPGSQFDDFSLALACFPEASERTRIDAAITSLSMDQLASLVPPPPVKPSELGPTGLVPGTRPGVNWMVDIDRGTISGYDETSRQGIFAVRDDPPEWEWGAPFRPHFHWAALASGDALMHGAVVGTADAALLLVGPGGTGKSTTTFAAVDRGAKTCGDDYVWLTFDDGDLVAHSIYGTAKAKKSSAVARPTSMFATRWRDSPSLNKRAYYVSMDRPQTFMESARVVAAVTLETSPTLGTSAREIESRELIQKALPSTILQAPSGQRQLLTRLTELLSPLPSYHLTLSPDLSESGDAILGLLDSVTAPSKNPSEVV